MHYLVSRELPADYSVVEIGVGSYNFPPAPIVIQDLFGRPNPHWSFTDGRSYTGIDAGLVNPGQSYPDPHDMIPRRAQERLAEYADWVRSRRPTENIRFLFGDATDPNLDVPPASANELLMFDVLSSNINTLDRERLLAQGAQRLLVAGGLLVVRETFTSHLHPPEKLIEKLGRLSFENIEVITSQDEVFAALTQYYGPTSNDVHNESVGIRPKPNRYFCIAQQPE